MLDLYGGSGAVAMSLAARGARVHVVESFPPAAEQARRAAAALSVDVECCDVERALRRMAGAAEVFDAAVVNPPRRGTSPAARDWLARLAPASIAYVSCNPETLARDLDHFARLGYEAHAATPLDMIPLSEEVETVAQLVRAEPTVPNVLYEDEDVIVVDKAAHEPTARQKERCTCLVDRTRRIAGADRAVPAHRPSAGTSGPVLFVRQPEAAPQWSAAIAAGQSLYIALVHGRTRPRGVVPAPPGTREVPRRRTRFRRIDAPLGHSLLRLTSDAHRDNPLRAGLAAMGHPILGDARYGHAAANRYLEHKHALDRLFLHSAELQLPDPRDPGRLLVARAGLPPELRAVLAHLGASIGAHACTGRKEPSFRGLSF